MCRIRRRPDPRPLVLRWGVSALALGCGRERRNPLDPETSLVKERLSPPTMLTATAGKGLVGRQQAGFSSRLLAGYALTAPSR
ncbi:MAG: hypothetical protein FJY95_02085 [Candidatus Handelsmanbacteria bacterium]|nr:hypothetical protein [Candidatus Handelsmanbacteria bacterium]